MRNQSHSRLFVKLALVLIAIAAFMLLPRNNRPQEAETGEAVQSAAPTNLSVSRASIETRRTLSSTNAEFQEFGRKFMAAQVSAFLTRAPLFGLSNAAPEQLKFVSLIDGPSAEYWAQTTNGSHRFRYKDGRLWDAIAVNADLLGVGRNPQKIGEWGAVNATWTPTQATNAFFKTVSALGIQRDELKEAAGPPEVNADPIYVGTPSGELRSVVPFYTVRLFDKQGGTMIEARYRADNQGTWNLTFWNCYLFSHTPGESDQLMRRFFP